MLLNVLLPATWLQVPCEDKLLFSYITIDEGNVRCGYFIDFVMTPNGLYQNRILYGGTVNKDIEGHHIIGTVNQYHKCDNGL